MRSIVLIYIAISSEICINFTHLSIVKKERQTRIYFRLSDAKKFTIFYSIKDVMTNQKQWKCCKIETNPPLQIHVRLGHMELCLSFHK